MLPLKAYYVINLNGGCYVNVPNHMLHHGWVIYQCTREPFSGNQRKSSYFALTYHKYLLMYNFHHLQKMMKNEVSEEKKKTFFSFPFYTEVLSFYFFFFFFFDEPSPPYPQSKSRVHTLATLRWWTGGWMRSGNTAFLNDGQGSILSSCLALREPESSDTLSFICLKLTKIRLKTGRVTVELGAELEV